MNGSKLSLCLLTCLLFSKAFGQGACSLPGEVTYIIPEVPQYELGIVATLLKPHLEASLNVSINIIEVVGEKGLLARTKLANSSPDGSVLGSVVAGSEHGWQEMTHASELTIMGPSHRTPAVLWSHQDSSFSTFLRKLQHSPFPKMAYGHKSPWKKALEAYLKTQGVCDVIEPIKVVQENPMSLLVAQELDFVVSGPLDIGAVPVILRDTIKPLALFTNVTGLMQPRDIVTLGSENPNLKVEMWNGLALPPHTPPHILECFQNALTQALAQESLQKSFKVMGLIPHQQGMGVSPISH